MFYMSKNRTLENYKEIQENSKKYRKNRKKFKKIQENLKKGNLNKIHKMKRKFLQ